MKLQAEISVNLELDEVRSKLTEANRLAMRDTVVAVHARAVEDSPVRTGNNRRSISSEVSGMGSLTGESAGVVSDSEVEGAVYSTSGYGGYLETGTKRMSPQPYLKPALDREFTVAKYSERLKGYL